MTVQYAQPLCVAEQFEAAPEHRIVARLAGVAGDSPALREAIYRQPEVEFGRRTTAECGTELEVEGGGDLLGEGPRDHREISTRGANRRFGGARMVGVTGDAALVEDEEHIGVEAFDHCLDIRAKGVEAHHVELPVGVVKQAYSAHPERCCCPGEFALTHAVKIAV